MVIDKVGTISQIQQAYSNQVRKNAGAKDAPARADQVELSKAGKQAQAQSVAVSAAKETVAKAPDVRREKVEQAKAKLESGQLLNDKVYEEIAARIVDSMGLG